MGRRSHFSCWDPKLINLRAERGIPFHIQVRPAARIHAIIHGSAAESVATPITP